MSNYSNKLKDPRWQKKRLEILQRDNFTCLECQSNEKTLHVHHTQYVFGRDVWDYHNDSLITLCCDCHHDITSVKSEVKEIIDTQFTSFSQLSELHGILADIYNLPIGKLIEVGQFCKSVKVIKNG